MTVWGGPNVLAQALWKVRATRSPQELERFVAKLPSQLSLGLKGLLRALDPGVAARYDIPYELVLAVQEGRDPTSGAAAPAPGRRPGRARRASAATGCPPTSRCTTCPRPPWRTAKTPAFGVPSHSAPILVYQATGRGSLADPLAVVLNPRGAVGYGSDTLLAQITSWEDLPVSEETRAVVLEAALRLGYAPSPGSSSSGMHWSMASGVRITASCATTRSSSRRPRSWRLQATT